MEGFELFDRPYRGFAAAPTNDGLTMVVVGWPIAEFAANKKDVEGSYMAAIDMAPELAERVRGATRETRFVGTADLPGFFCRPYGEGWALVGDAGYHKDPITAQGISDAFRDAEALAAGLDDVFCGRAEFDDAMARYQRARDEAVLALFEFTCDLAKLQPAPPEMQQLMGAVHGNQEAMDDFVSVIAGTVSPEEFFAPENVSRLMSAGAVVG